MKLSFAISIQKTSFDYIVKSERWERNLKLLANLGYDGVELGIRDPELLNIDVLEKELAKNKLELSAIGTGQAYLDDGLSLSSLKKSIRNNAIKRINKHVDIASFFNSQVIIGLIRGKKEQLKNGDKQFESYFIDSVSRICDYAVSKKTILAIEPLNRYEADFLNGVEETISFIKKIKCDNLKLLIDTFHMNIEERNLIDPINKAKTFLSHVHLADNNRKCPGDGYINFKKIVSALKKVKFRGYLSGEMLPEPSTEYCMKKYFNVIKPFVGEN